MKLASCLAVCLMAPLFAGCVIRSSSDDDDGGTGGTGNAGSGGEGATGTAGSGNATSQGGEFIASTVNAGLNDDAAASDVAAALAELNVDALCLQEVWSADAADTVNAALIDRLPEILTITPAEEDEAYASTSFGLVFATRAPFSDTDELVLPGTLHHRGVIYAELETEVGPVHVFCTQLGTIEAEEHPDGTWQQEHEDQTNALAAFVADKTEGVAGAVVIMGDLNAGPGGEGYEPVLDGDYQALLGDGLTNAYIDGEETCTVCADNPLGDGAENSITDHILVGAFQGQVETDLVLNTDETAVGAHYGLVTVLLN